jgi:hypothetical protein
MRGPLGFLTLARGALASVLVAASNRGRGGLVLLRRRPSAGPDGRAAVSAPGHSSVAQLRQLL